MCQRKDDRNVRFPFAIPSSDRAIRAAVWLSAGLLAGAVACGGDLTHGSNPEDLSGGSSAPDAGLTLDDGGPWVLVDVDGGTPADEDGGTRADEDGGYAWNHQDGDGGSRSDSSDAGSSTDHDDAGRSSMMDGGRCSGGR